MNPINPNFHSSQQGISISSLPEGVCVYIFGKFLSEQKLNTLLSNPIHKASVQWIKRAMFYQIQITPPLFLSLLDKKCMLYFQTIITHKDFNRITDKEGNTILMLTVQKNRENICQRLLERQDLDVNCKNNEADTALIQTVKQNRENICRQLLKRQDLDVNCKNKYDVTPLMLVSLYGAEEIGKQLLKHKDIDVNYQVTHNNSVQSALSYAMSYDCASMVKQLKAHPNIDPDFVSKCTCDPGRSSRFLVSLHVKRK